MLYCFQSHYQRYRLKYLRDAAVNLVQNCILKFKYSPIRILLLRVGAKYLFYRQLYHYILIPLLIIRFPIPNSVFGFVLDAKLIVLKWFLVIIH